MGNVVILMSNEPELRMRRVCFTGHRPEKLNKSEAEIVASLEREIRAAITDGFQTFISGMARGGLRKSSFVYGTMALQFI